LCLRNKEEILHEKEGVTKDSHKINKAYTMPS
jgi:hypothetical protein